MEKILNEISRTHLGFRDAAKSREASQYRSFNTLMNNFQKMSDALQKSFKVCLTILTFYALKGLDQV